MNIRENGCRLHPDCFTCPEPDCRSREISQRWLDTHERVKALATAGTRIGQISQAVGVSERTVYRHLHQLRGQP